MRVAVLMLSLSLGLSVGAGAAAAPTTVAPPVRPKTTPATTSDPAVPEDPGETPKGLHSTGTASPPANKPEPNEPMDDHFEVGHFGQIAVYRPKGEVKEVVLFISGDGGWHLGVVSMAQKLAERGALVAGIDVRHFLGNLEHIGESCSYPAGELETLAHHLEAREKLKDYRYPLLVGYSSGATLVYGAMTQAPSGTFAGGLGLGFCPDLSIDKPLCKANALTYTKRKGRGYDLGRVDELRDPFIALQGAEDRICIPEATRQFVESIKGGSVVMLPKVGHGYANEPRWLPQYLAAYDKLTAAPQNSVPPPPDELSDLPLVEAPTDQPGDTLAVLITGDGGWAGLDQDVAKALQQRGMPVAALNSLKYFWTARTPQQTADAVDRIAKHYLATWHRRKLVLIGYSQGADMVPFVVNRLSADTRGKLIAAAAIGLSDKAVFEFKFANWISDPANGIPTRPEIAKFGELKLTCIYGRKEDDALCPLLDPAHSKAIELPGGHHFNGDYEAVAKAVLGGL